MNYVQKQNNNSYDYVDLGLPSGLLWATKNIGANTEEEAGLYFQWGDTQGYTAEQVGVGEGGYLWASSLDSSDVQGAWVFGFDAGGGDTYGDFRFDGVPVRGVLAQ